MNEAEYLASYDPSNFDRPSLAVDLVLLTVQDRQLRVLLHNRAEQPFQGAWGLPGTFVRIDEDLDAAAHRALNEKAKLPTAFVEQLYTFGDPARDPRMRVVTVAYLGLMPPEPLLAVTGGDLELGFPARQAGCFQVLDTEGEALKLPFDHQHIIEVAVDRLRAKLDWSDLAFALLDAEFTLRDLQHVHEAIRGEQLNKPAFRRRMLDAGRIEPTGRREAGAAYRPAELYRVRGNG